MTSPTLPTHPDEGVEVVEGGSIRPVPIGPSPVRATLLSALWPGLGQWYAGHRMQAVVHAAPIALAALVAIILLLQGGQDLAVLLLQPVVALFATIIVIGLAAWRLGSMAHAGSLGGRHHRVTAAGGVAVALAGVIIIVLHGFVASTTWAFFQAGQAIFQPAPGDIAGPSPGPGESPGSTAPPPLPTERVTVLFIGIDATATRVGEARLTDTIMVASFDPATGSLDMVSVPRDVALFPIYDQRDELFPGKINEFMEWADARESRYRQGGTAAFVRQIEYLLGIDIDYYASVEIPGFARMVDAVGGVDIVNETLIDDPTYQISADRIGWRLEPGPYHMDGATALIYVRSRHGIGNSDYQRARRQQQVLLELRRKVDDPQVVLRLPEILDAAASAVRTDLPPDQLPVMIELARASSGADVRSFVLGPTRYASVIPPDEIGGLSALRLDLDAVAELSVRLWGSDSSYSRR